MRRATTSAFFLVVLVCVVQVWFGTGVAAEGAEPSQPNAATSLYWVEWDSNQIRRGNADGSGNSSGCLNAVADISGIVLDSAAGKMYWIERDQGRLRSANLDCSGVITLNSTLVNADRLALDISAGKLYWTENNGTNRIRRANLNGSGIETVLSSLGRPVGVVVDTINDFIYWTEQDSRSVWRATLTGANKTMIVPAVDGQSTPLDIVVDPARNRLYWIVGETGAIYASTLTGGGAGIWLDLPNPRYVTVDVDSGRVYWGDWDAQEIRRADSNGSNNQLLFSSSDGVVQPRAIALAYSSSVTCYALTRNHTGQGSDPVASPNKSAGCSTGQYISGESITLTATPSADWSVAGWSGTNNDGSTATTNMVTMPAAAHTVSVAYVQTAPTCYTLTRSHTGQGSNPSASPTKSTECSTGQYVAGEFITLTATPAAGWRVGGWSGTSNDGSTANSNTVTMPAAAHTIRVAYVEEISALGRTVLPMILNVGFSEFSPFEVEPNNSDTTANGRLLFNRNYQGYPNDREDFFYFDVPPGEPLTLNFSLDHITGTDPQLQLHPNGYPNPVDSDTEPPFRFSYVAPPGRYYLRIVVVGGYNTHTAYVLRVETEETE